MLRRMLPGLFMLAVLLTFASAPRLWGEDPFVDTVSAGGATATASATAPPTATATGVPSLTATTGATSTVTPTTTTVASPGTATATGTTTPGATAADLQLTVSANPNPVTSGQVFSYFIRVFNQGGTASPASHVRITIPGGASTSLATGSGNCVLNQSTGQYSIPGTGQNYATYNQCISASGAGSPNCQFNATTQQYYNATTGQVYSSYSQCISAAGTGSANCVLNLTTGQYFNAATGQTYNSYNDCINASGVGIANCTLIPGTSQYYNSATGQVYATQTECTNASGTGVANCVVIPGTTQYYNPATGQVYSTYTECVAAGGSGPIVGSNCAHNNFQNYVDCPIPSLQPGTSASLSVPFFVTAVGGTIFTSFQVDPNNVVTESNETNNTATFSVTVIPGLSGQFPFPPPPPPLLPEEPPPAPAPPAPPIAGEPVPPVFVPAPPAVQPPAATGLRWLHVLSPTQAYSVTMDPMWTAMPGEWYFVVSEEAGWALAVWEGDTSDWTEWIQIDGRVEIVIANRPIPQLPLWLIVLSPTQAYSVTMDPLWTAATGERYKVREEEGGWALAIWEFDTPDWQVWIQVDGRVQLSRM